MEGWARANLEGESGAPVSVRLVVELWFTEILGDQAEQPFLDFLPWTRMVCALDAHEMALHHERVG